MTQLQQELQNQEKSRDSLTRELTEIIKTNQELTSRLHVLEVLHVEFEDLKTKYNALLQVWIWKNNFFAIRNQRYVSICKFMNSLHIQMYGEKIEENEELRLDLLDVKEMYKAQVNLLYNLIEISFYFTYLIVQIDQLMKM